MTSPALVGVEYFSGEMFSSTEKSYHRARIMIQKKLKSNRSTLNREKEVSTKLINKSGKLKLLQINLNCFDGNCMKWRPFKDFLLNWLERIALYPTPRNSFFLKANITGEPSSIGQELSHCMVYPGEKIWEPENNPNSTTANAFKSTERFKGYNQSSEQITRHGPSDIRGY